MNKSLGSRIAIGAAALALVGVFTLLLAKTRAIDFETHNEIVGTLRQLKQVDAEWNVDVLRSRTGLNTNYDPVASPLPLIESLGGALKSKTGAFWHEREESGARIDQLFRSYKTAMDKKIATIERFKSHNSILRNSSRFLPIAANDLIAATRETKGSEALRNEIEESLNDLLTSTMTYTLTPDALLREKVETGMRSIQQQTGTLGPDVRDRADTLLAHAGTVLKQQQTSDALLAELSAMPTAKAIDALADAHAQEHEKLLVTQQGYRLALIAYSCFLLMLLAWLGWRLLKNYRLLNRTNAALQQTNQQLKESQVHLVQAEKMSALGQMVAGIAHEINTPLAYVKGTFDVLKEQLAPIQDLAQRSYDFAQLARRRDRQRGALNAPLLDVEAVAKRVVDHGVLAEMGTLLKDGVHGIEQISEIVLNLKNFSRLDRAKVSSFSVQAGLDSTLLLAKNLLKNKVEIRKEYGADVPEITCSPSQVNQVFLNIITNAVHAMPERAEPNLITLRTAREKDDMVRIEIQDNGTGIPNDVLPKIFDPFFTTKPIGQGTGMGLSISYKIIHEHGGRISVDTEQGVGTVFTILLPVRPPARAADEPESIDLLAAAA